MTLSFYSDNDFRLWGLLSHARDAIFKARGAELARYGVSSVETFALFVLNELGEMANAAEVSRMMYREHNTVSALLVRMEKKGLVERVRDPNRKNIWRVSLTERGAAACKGAMQMESLHVAFSDISDTDKQRLLVQLRSVRDKALSQLVSQPVRRFPERTIFDGDMGTE